ncbi:hypothetical protein [Pseudoalteromonas rubra]|uniref:hypothetical protein n=1 Tax=Pseudoalteromonas rubra TaxID=43658 RepID=UPI000F791D92|nr:hypothetical protein [Pseudoalteromonas rubra]
MNRIYKITTLTIAIIFSMSAWSNPKVRYEPESFVEAIAFADKLSGTTWLYHWRGQDYKFRFNENGTIGILEGWRNITWVVAGKEDVILEAKTGKMLLRFNDSKTTFYTRDWDGLKSDGRIVR